MAITFPQTSAYFLTPQTSWYTLPIVFRDIPADTSDILITGLESKYEFRPDKLSYDLYNTSQYYWIFMARNLNVIRDPIWDFKSGINIYVPTLAHLQDALGGS